MKGVGDGLIPLTLEKCETSWRNDILMFPVEVQRSESSLRETVTVIMTGKQMV